MHFHFALNYPFSISTCTNHRRTSRNYGMTQSLSRCNKQISTCMYLYFVYLTKYLLSERVYRRGIIYVHLFIYAMIHMAWPWRWQDSNKTWNSSQKTICLLTDWQLWLKNKYEPNHLANSYNENDVRTKSNRN